MTATRPTGSELSRTGDDLPVQRWRAVGSALILTCWLLATPSFAKVAQVELSELVAASDLIGVGRVTAVRRTILGKRVARAQIVENWKGVSSEVEFLASPTWICDITTASVGDTLVFFLARARGRRYEVLHAGRGLMPVRETTAGPVADFWPDVQLPAEVATLDGPDLEADFIRSVALDVLRSLVGVGQGLSLSIRVDEPIERGRPFRVFFEATNTSAGGFYFKRPWKWASNGLRLRAQRSDGALVESTTILYDIDSRRVCSYSSSLRPGQSLVFEEELGWGPGLPSLPFTEPGRYELEWVYEPRVYSSDESCTSRGWPMWRARVVSPRVEIEVR